MKRDTKMRGLISAGVIVITGLGMYELLEKASSLNDTAEVIEKASDKKIDGISYDIISAYEKDLTEAERELVDDAADLALQARTKRLDANLLEFVSGAVLVSGLGALAVTIASSENVQRLGSEE